MPLTQSSLESAPQDESFINSGGGDHSETGERAFGLGPSIERNTSIARVDFDFTQEGRHLSVPVVDTSIAPQGTDYFQYEDGYDSNNELGPFWNAVEGLDPDDNDDDIVPQEPRLEPPRPEPPQVNQPETPTDVALAEEVTRTMTNAKLKEE